MSAPVWTKTSIGSDFHAGQMRLSTSDQCDRGCGWVWHAYFDEYVEQPVAGAGFANEDEAKTAAIKFARDYCAAVLAAFSDIEIVEIAAARGFEAAVAKAVRNQCRLQGR